MKQLIYGLGRFGNFFSQIIKDAGQVYGFNRSLRELPTGILPIKPEAFHTMDIVWITSAISSVGEVCKSIAPLISEKTLVIDTCSVKVNPVKAMLSNLNINQPILASHPMFGPDSAKNGLQGLSLVLCPVRNTVQQFDFWKAYFESLGILVYEMTPEEHDREAAFTQGLTHLVGRILKEMDLNDSKIATLGYKKIKEVMEQTCNDPWQLFLELQQENPYGKDMRKLFQTSLETVYTKAGFIDSKLNL